MRRSLIGIIAVSLLLGLASGASAQDEVLREVDRFLKQSSDTLDENLLFGKLRFTPSLNQQLIYDDNIWLNDRHEGNSTPEGRQTRGREWDFISQTALKMAFDLPVNKDYSKFFERDRLTVLGADFSVAEYFRSRGPDAFNYKIYTDLFGFLDFFKNLFDLQLGKPEGFFVDLGASYTDQSNPLDLQQRALGPTLTGVPVIPNVIRTDRKLRWNEFHGNAVVGYRGNKFDVRVGYNFDWFHFRDDFYQQADHRTHSVFVEVGIQPPFMNEDSRLYTRVKYSDLEFREGVLNDAEIWDARLGYSGPLVLIPKFQFQAEIGVRHWNSQDTGGFTVTLPGGMKQFRENPDKDDVTGIVGMFRVAYQPFEQRATLFQFEYGRDIDWSAISNFRSDVHATFTVFDQLIKEKLDGDLTVSWSSHDPSDGPRRYLIEIGAGVTFHLLEQVDLTARYLYRLQQSSDELTVNFFQGGGGNASLVTLRTDGDFFQNIFSVGIDVRF